MMRHGREPEVWPPADFAEADPVGLLDQAYAELRTEFAARESGDASKTWYGPDQTVGFWVRRMAQETVIHRIDAELGAGAPIAPVPGDLAVDGIDELLEVFVAYSFSQWPEDFTEALKNTPGRAFKIKADETPESQSVSWLVRIAPDHLAVEGGPDEEAGGTVTPDVAIGGAAADVLRWAWNREALGDVSPLRIKGDAEALTEFRACVVEATQ